jgi:acetyl-CoA acyltransferase
MSVEDWATAMRAEGDRWGVAAICMGLDQGLAVLLENQNAS